MNNNNELDTLNDNHNDVIQDENATSTNIIYDAKPLISSVALAQLTKANALAIFFTICWSLFGVFNKLSTYWLVLVISFIVSITLSVISIYAYIRLKQNSSLSVIDRIYLICKILLLCGAYALIFMFAWSFYIHQ